MPYCPKCNHKLSKRKSDMTFNCVRHGFVRRVYSPGWKEAEPKNFTNNGEVTQT